MPKKAPHIPVNAMANEYGEGITVERTTIKNLSDAERAILNSYEDGRQAHRHDGHSFFLLESGTVSIEIDFEKYQIESPSITYIHPDQVHHTITSDNVTVSSWAITNENLNPEYLSLLESIAPAKPILLQPETFAIFAEAVSLSIKLSVRKMDKLYHALLKDSCNALVALAISQYLAQATPIDKLTRFEAITKTFREAVKNNYTKLKRPAAYAEMMNISTTYLNECVKNTTGYPVSYHIQQRVILEAKRLLCHSDKSVKEIAALLGYDDYPYFSRLFTKATDISALAFRIKNRV